jgi:hypothetical protein
MYLTPSAQMLIPITSTTRHRMIVHRRSSKWARKGFVSMRDRMSSSSGRVIFGNLFSFSSMKPAMRQFVRAAPDTQAVRI